MKVIIMLAWSVGELTFKCYQVYLQMKSKKCMSGYAENRMAAMWYVHQSLVMVHICMYMSLTLDVC